MWGCGVDRGLLGIHKWVKCKNINSKILINQLETGIGTLSKE